jgi:hypothetical protein
LAKRLPLPVVCTPAVVSRNKSAGERVNLREEKSTPIARLAQHNSQYALARLHLHFIAGLTGRLDPAMT